MFETSLEATTPKENEIPLQEQMEQVNLPTESFAITEAQCK
jgi:hypothetical protein